MSRMDFAPLCRYELCDELLRMYREERDSEDGDAFRAWVLWSAYQALEQESE